MMQKLWALFQKMETFMDRVWYLPLVGLVVGLDLFLLIIPSDGIVITSALGLPRKRLSVFFWSTTGSALGAVALAGLALWGGAEGIDALASQMAATEGWRKSAEILGHHGAWAIALIAVSPLPQQPVILLAGLSGMNLMQVFCSVWLGRAVKYGFYCWAAAKAPALFMRSKVLRAEIQRLQALRDPPGDSDRPISS